MISCLVSGMPRVYQRKTKQGQYDPRLLSQAIDEVKKGRPLSTVSKELKVPRSTIRRHLDGNVRRRGGQTILTTGQEATLSKRILEMCSRGFPLNVTDARSLAFRFASQLQRRKQLKRPLPKAWSQTKKASFDWWNSFKVRHQALALRIPEGISAARAEAFNEKRIEEFFRDLREVFDDNDFHQFPQLVFNCDETGLSSCPQNGKRVIAARGARLVQKLQPGERGSLTTVLVCSSATGELIPPFIIFKGSPPDGSDFPKDSHLCGSKSAYIDSGLFIEFLKHFNKHRPKIPGKKCLLILDGHSSHLSVESLEFCSENEIELICLPPHSSHRLQPLDTHFNKSFKSLWAIAVSEHLRNHEKVTLTKWDFGSCFEKVWGSMLLNRGLMVNAFQHCGLFPVRNTVEKAEFLLAESFKESTSESRVVDANDCLLKTLMPSPKKNANENHTKPHVAHVTSPQFIEQKVNRKKLRIRLLNVGKSDSSNCKPSTSRGRNAVSEHLCCVCQASWSDTNEEWLKCNSCGKWACESCFLAVTCVKCN